MFNEQNISEEYPQTFNMDDFKALRSFSARLKYAEERLQKIGSGSARTVFKIDDDKVLKIAKNPKGIAQNEQEASQSNDYMLDGFVADTFDNHPDFHWIEMELAQKLTPTKFKQVTGVDIKQMDTFIRNEESRINGKRGGFQLSIDPQVEEQMRENEFVQQVIDYIGNYGTPAGDLGRLSSYGLVKKDGVETIILVDYGLTDDIYKKFYQKNEGYSKIKKIVREMVEKLIL